MDWDIMANCIQSEIGNMRHRIEVQSQTATSDGAGGWVRVWQTDLSAWASIQPLNGYEKFQASQMETDITHKIMTRYQSGITTKHRIKFDDRYFNIVEVLNIDQRNAMLKITAVEGAGT